MNGKFQGVFSTDKEAKKLAQAEIAQLPNSTTKRGGVLLFYASKNKLIAVIPAQAGIHNLQTFGICGNSDAHLLGSEFMDSRLRGNDGLGHRR